MRLLFFATMVCSSVFSSMAEEIGLAMWSPDHCETTGKSQLGTVLLSRDKGSLRATKGVSSEASHPSTTESGNPTLIHKMDLHKFMPYFDGVGSAYHTTLDWLAGLVNAASARHDQVARRYLYTQSGIDSLKSDGLFDDVGQPLVGSRTPAFSENIKENLLRLGHIRLEQVSFQVGQKIERWDKGEDSRAVASASPVKVMQWIRQMLGGASDNIRTCLNTGLLTCWKSKAHDPMCRLLVALCVLLVLALFTRMHASRQARLRADHAKKRQQDDEKLGYLFKARRLQQNGSAHSGLPTRAAPRSLGLLYVCGDPVLAGAKMGVNY